LTAKTVSTWLAKSGLLSVIDQRYGYSGLLLYLFHIHLEDEMKKLIVFVVAALMTANCAFAEQPAKSEKLPKGAYYLDGELILPPKAQAKKFKEGEFIINKKGMKQKVVLELGWGTGDYEVGYDEIGETQFMKIGPTAIAVDSNGDIYICDRYNRRVLVYNSAGKFKMKFRDPGTDMIELGDDGYIYTCSSGSREVYVYSKKGELIREFSIPRMAGGGETEHLIVKDGAIYIHGGRGYQKVEQINEKSFSFNGKKQLKLEAVTGEYIEGSPYEGYDPYKGNMFSELDPIYKDLGIGTNTTGRRYLKGKQKLPPRIVSVSRTGENKNMLILHIFDADTQGTAESICIPKSDYGFDNNMLYITDKGDVYLLYSEDNIVKVLSWTKPGSR